MSTATYSCPKCRDLGLAADCSERLVHASSPVKWDGDEPYDVDVTFTFTIPVPSSLPLDPHEMATHLREAWMNEDSDLKATLAEAVDGEYDLKVAPVFGL